MGNGRFLGQILFWRALYIASFFAVTLFLSRFLQAGEAGRIFFFSSNVVLLSMLLSCSMDSAIVYFAASGKIEKEKVLGFSLVSTVLTTFLCLAVITTFPGFFRLQPAEVVPYTLLYAPGITLLNLMMGLANAGNHFRLPNMVMSIGNMALLLLIPLQPFDNDAQKHLRLLIYLGSFLLQGGIVLALYMRAEQIRTIRFPSWQQVAAIYRYAFPVLMANLFFQLMYRVDYWFVSGMLHDTESLGNYIQASKMGQALLFLPQLMASILYPQAARETDPHRMVRKVLTATRLILLVMLLAFAVLLLLPADIFEHIFGASFNHMYRPLCLLMPGITGLALQCMLSAYFSGINRVRVNVYGALAGLFTVVIADSLLIPRYGIDGAAIASTIAYLASLALSMVYFSRKNRIGLLQFFRFRRNDLADTLQHFVKR